MEVTGTQRIAAAFDSRQGVSALMPYLMGCFPGESESVEIGLACVESGADLLEVGVPYSDPLADGPVIHAAATSALGRGATLDGVLAVVSQLSARIPVVVMCYANLVLSRGWDRFATDLQSVGGSGLICPDLPLEEAPDAAEALGDRGLAHVPLAAPTTPDDRLARIGAQARGFLYTVSVAGTTGEREGAGSDMSSVVERAKQATDVPVAVGFGISSPEQARSVADAGADGVIVGSRLVRAAAGSSDPAGAVGDIVSELAGALR